MSSASAAIVAPLPAPPTNVVAAPSAPMIIGTAPIGPQSVIDGSTVPVIPPFVRANFGGGGASAASYTSTSPLAAQGGAVGALGAALTAQLPISVTAAATGALGCTLAYGAGTTRTISAQFAATGNPTATNAAFGCVAALAVSVDKATSSTLAGFGSTTGLLSTQSGPPPTANASGSAMGSLAATTGVLAAFGGTGALAASLWAPSGMTKNGNQTGPNATSAWTQIINWTANTAGFPGSQVSSNALVAQGTKSNATVTATIAWTPGGGFPASSLAVRIKQNGNPIATGTTSTSSPAQISATVNVAVNDKFMVEVEDTSANASVWQSTITGGATSTLQLT